MVFKTKKFQLVELIIPATLTGTNAQVFFQNQPQLQSISGDRRIYIKKIEAYTDDTLVGSPLSNGNTMVTAADIINATLVISISGENSVMLLPLSDLCQVIAPGTFSPNNYTPFILKNQWRVDWTKSYIQIITAPVNLPKTYILGVHYDYEPDYDDLSQDEFDEFVAYVASVPNYPLSRK
jgi:hypothetical protein